MKSNESTNENVHSQFRILQWFCWRLLCRNWAHSLEKPIYNTHLPITMWWWSYFNIEQMKEGYSHLDTVSFGYFWPISTFQLRPKLKLEKVFHNCLSAQVYSIKLKLNSIIQQRCAEWTNLQWSASNLPHRTTNSWLQYDLCRNTEADQGLGSGWSALFSHPPSLQEGLV